MQRIFQDSLKTGSMSLVQLVTSGLISIFWARYLGPEQFGMFMFMFVTTSTTALLFNPCLYTAANYYTSKALRSGDEIWSTLLFMSLAYGAVASVASLLIFQFFYPLSEVASLFIVIATVSIVATANFSGFLFGSRRVSRITLWNALNGVLYVIGIVLFWYIFDDLNWVHATGLYAGIQASNMVVLPALAWTKQQRIRIDWPLAWEMTRYGAFVYPGRVATFLNYRIDAYIIVALLGSSAFSMYSVATSVAEMIWKIPVSVNLIILANIAGLELSVAAQRVMRISRLISLIMLLLAFGIVVCSQWLIRVVYGAAYEAAYLPLVLLLPGVVAFAVAKILEPFFQCWSKPGLPSQAAMVGVAVNVVANIVLIPQMGVAGAALASTLSYTAQVLVLALSWGRFVSLPWWKLFIPALRLPDEGRVQDGVLP